jgi:hypothetical protein
MDSTKTQMINAIMKNPKLSKDLRDALAAPLGSTQRKKAQMIFRSMNASNRSRINPQDGQGGSLLDPFSLQKTAPATGPKATAKAPVVKTPPPPTNPGIVPSPRNIASTTPALPSFIPPTPVNPNSQTPLQSIGNFFGNVGRGAVVAGKAIGNTAASLGSDMVNMAGTGIVKQVTSPYTAVKNISGAVSSFAEWLNTLPEDRPEKIQSDLAVAIARGADAFLHGGEKGEKYTISDVLSQIHNAPRFKNISEVQINKELTAAIAKAGGKVGSQTAQTAAKANALKNVPVVQSKVGQKTASTTQNVVNPPVNQQITNGPSGALPNTQQPSGNPAPVGSSTENTVVQNVPGPTVTPTGAAGPAGPAGPAAPASSPTYDSYMSDPMLGGEGAAMALLGTPAGRIALAKKMNIRVEDLPDTSLIFKNISDVEDKLKKELKLNELRDAMLQRTLDGKNIENDLKEEFRNRDTYVKEVDALMDSAREMRKGMDMANPMVAKDYNNYMQYLTTLKAKQQARYTDFSNSAINNFNARSTEIENKYKLMQDEYNTELDRFKNEQGLNITMYNQLKSSLAEQWKLYQSKEEIAYNSLKIKYDTAVIQKSLVGEAISGWTEPDRPEARKYMDDSTRSKIIVPNSTNPEKGTKMTTGNLWDIFVNFSTQNASADRKREPLAVLAEYNSEISSNAYSQSGAGTDKTQMQDVMSNYIGGISSFYEGAKAAANGDATKLEGAKSQAQAMLDTLGSGIYSGVKSSLTGDVLESTKTALDDLSKVKTSTIIAEMKAGGNSSPTLNNWVTKHSQNVNAGLLNIIAGFIMSNVDASYSTIGQLILTQAANQPSYANNPEWKKSKIKDFMPDDIANMVSAQFNTLKSYIK